MAEQSSGHAFISYFRDDKARVSRFVGALKSHGVACWMDTSGIEGGANWSTLIQQKIESATAFILFVSKLYHERAESFVHREVEYACAKLRRMDSDQAWYLPVLLDDSALPRAPLRSGRDLTDYQATNARGDWRGAARALAARIKPKRSALGFGQSKLVFKLVNLISGDYRFIIRNDRGPVEVKHGPNGELLVRAGTFTVGLEISYTSSVPRGGTRVEIVRSNQVPLTARPRETITLLVRKSERRGFLWSKTENDADMVMEVVQRHL